MGNMPSCNPWDADTSYIDGTFSPDPSTTASQATTSLWRNNLITILRNALTYKNEGELVETSRLPDSVLSLISDYWGYNEALIMTGGNSGSSVTYPSAGCDIFDMDTRNLLHLVEMSSGRYNHSCVTLNGRVYVIGGISAPGQPCMTVDVLDLKTLRWRTICTLDIPRISTAVVSVPAFPSHVKAPKGIYSSPHSVFYLTGGTDGEQFLRHVLRYNPDTNMWSKLPRLNVGRRSHCMAYHNGYLIVAGGAGEQGELSSVEVLDVDKKRFQRYMTRRYLNEYYAARLSEQPHARVYDIVYPEVPHFKWTWLPLADMSTVRSGATACVLDEVLYVIGGHDGNKTLSSVEALDLSQLAHDGYASEHDDYQPADIPFALDHHGQRVPLAATTTLPPLHERHWAPAPALLQPRGGATAVVMEALGTVFVCGGFNGVSYLSDSETFTPVARRGSLLYRQENHIRELLLQHVHSRAPVRVRKSAVGTGASTDAVAAADTRTHTPGDATAPAPAAVPRVFVDENGHQHGSLTDVLVLTDHFSVGDQGSVEEHGVGAEGGKAKADVVNQGAGMGVGGEAGESDGDSNSNRVSESRGSLFGNFLNPVIGTNPEIIDPELSATPCTSASELGQRCVSESIGIIPDSELISQPDVFSPIAEGSTYDITTATLVPSPAPSPIAAAPTTITTSTSTSTSAPLPADADDFAPGVDYNRWSPACSLSSLQFTQDLATYVQAHYHSPDAASAFVRLGAIKEANEWRAGPYLRRAAHHACVVIQPYHDLTFLSGNIVTNAAPAMPDMGGAEGDGEGDDYEEETQGNGEGEGGSSSSSVGADRGADGKGVEGEGEGEEKRVDDEEEEDESQYSSKLSRAHIDKPSKKTLHNRSKNSDSHGNTNMHSDAHGLRQGDKSSGVSGDVGGDVGDVFNDDSTATPHMPMPSSSSGGSGSGRRSGSGSGSGKARRRGTRALTPSLSGSSLPSPALSPSSSLSSSPSLSLSSHAHALSATHTVVSLTSHRPSSYSSPISPSSYTDSGPMSPLPATVLRGKSIRNPESAVAHAIPSPTASPDTVLARSSHLDTPHYHPSARSRSTHHSLATSATGTGAGDAVSVDGDTASLNAFALAAESVDSSTQHDGADAGARTATCGTRAADAAAVAAEEEEKGVYGDDTHTAPGTHAVDAAANSDAGDVGKDTPASTDINIDTNTSSTSPLDPPVDELYALYNAYADPLAAEGPLSYHDPDIIISHEEIERQARQLRAGGTPTVAFMSSLDDLEHTRL